MNERERKQQNRVLLAVVLSTLVWWAFQTFVFLPQEQGRMEEQAPDSPEAMEATPEVVAKPTPELEPSTPGEALEAPEEPDSPTVEIEEIPLETRLVKGALSNLHASFSSLVVEGYMESEERGWIGGWLLRKMRGKPVGPRPGSCSTGTPVEMVRDPSRPMVHFQVQDLEPEAPYQVEREGQDLVFKRRQGALELELHYEYSTERSDIRTTMKVRNLGREPVEIRPRLLLSGTLDENAGGVYANARELLVRSDGKVRRKRKQKVLKKGRITEEGPVDLVAMGDRYFLVAFLPDQAGPAAASVAEGAQRIGVEMELDAATSLKGGDELAWSGRLFVGPKAPKELVEVDPRLRETVTFGVFAVLSWPILGLLRFFHGLLGSWGLAIILLTFVVKMLLLPLTQKSFESMEGMKRLQPQIDALKEKHKDNPAALNQATMELFRKEKVNPMGGCLPMMLQMPIWFALYRVLWMSIDLYQQPFLWFCDLTARDPYAIMPLVLGVTMFIQTHLQPKPSDPTQATMTRIMPLMFTVFMFPLPAGLVLYILVNNLLTILQQVYIRKKLAAKLAA